MVHFSGIVQRVHNRSLDVDVETVFFLNKKARPSKKTLATYANLPNNRRQHPSVAAQRNAKRRAFDDSLDAMFEKERKSLESD